MKLVFKYSELKDRWSAQLLAIGLLVPDILDLVVSLLNMMAENSHALPGISADAKAWIRIGCMVGAMIVLLIQQKKLQMKKDREEALRLRGEG